MTRIVFCGGGTGGHVAPAVALIEQLQRIGPVEAQLLGTSRAGEQAILERTKIGGVPVYGLSRRMSDHVTAFRRARRMLRDSNPDVVVGLGGYAAFAGVAAAVSLGLRCVLLEQNAVVGRANDALRRLGVPIIHGFPTAASKTNRDVITTPVREPFARLARLATNRNVTCRRLLVLGGSQGASVVSDAAAAAVMQAREQLQGWRIAHQAPERDVERIAADYASLGIHAEVATFFDDLPTRLAAGPLVVSRAGGSTIAELACAGVPVVLIPHAAAVRDHQRRNAQEIEENGAAVVLDETELDRLGNVLSWLIETPFLRLRLAAAFRSLAQPEAAALVLSRLFGRFEGAQPAAGPHGDGLSIRDQNRHTA